MHSTSASGPRPSVTRRPSLHLPGTAAGSRALRRLVLALLAALTVLGSCTRLDLAYGTAPFLIQRWADGYLDLDRVQSARWEPRIKAALAAHRAAELPLLAGFFDTLHQASVRGFDPANTRCLTATFEDLYRRHARIAVDLAAPLLAELTPAQIRAMEQAFDAQTAKDRAEPSYPEFERARRARRYVKSIEEWTGPLSASQRTLVAEVTGKMPLMVKAALDYRTQNFAALIALLRTRPGEAAIADFLTGWLVELRGRPPALTAAVAPLRTGVEDLLMRLGASLNQTQQSRLSERLAGTRDDLLRLQQDPRMAAPTCRS